MRRGVDVRDVLAGKHHSAPPKQVRQISMPILPDRPWEHIEAVLTEREVVILAHPEDAALAALPEDYPHGHSCDQMGCGSMHVIARIELPSEVRSALALVWQSAARHEMPEGAVLSRIRGDA